MVKEKITGKYADNEKPTIIIMGPTCTGKSDIAIGIAEIINGEIISADSMQLYRGLDIGTAKVKKYIRNKIQHHLIDIADINEKVDIYQYIEKANRAISLIKVKNRYPIVVGGTGLYLKSLIYGLDPLPSNDGIKRALYEKYDNNIEQLKKDCSQLDPKAYEKFKNNPRKLIRALEVLNITGKSIIEQQKQWRNSPTRDKLFLQFLIKMDRKSLYKKIEERTEKMLKEGWIEEVKIVKKRGFMSSPTAWQAIGYNIIADYLDQRITYQQMKQKIVATTKRYARRQESWFKNQHNNTIEIRIDILGKEKAIEFIINKIDQFKAK